MTKPMSIDRLNYLKKFTQTTLEKLPSGDASANHWAWTVQECLDELDRLNKAIDTFRTELDNEEDCVYSWAYVDRLDEICGI